MSKEGSLRTRYLYQFRIGIGLLLVLAVPAIIHSHAAIESLMNSPPEWVPDSLPEKAAFNDFSKRFSVADIVMLSWTGAKLDSPDLQQAGTSLQFLTSESYDPATDEQRLADLPEPLQTEIREIREITGTATPLKWVRTGTETLNRMMAAPASLSRKTAIARLKGSLVGPDGEQTCIVVSIDEPGSVHRRQVFPKMRALAGAAADLPADKIAMVGTPFDGATVDNASVQSIQAFSPPSAILAAVLCFFCLRSIWLTATITIIAVIGEGIVLAIVYYTGTPMNAVLIVLPPLVFVLTVSAGIHLSNYYLDARHEFADLNSVGAAKRAMRAGLAPCLLATATTVIGLGSLMLVRLEPIRIFGFVASVGVISTLLLLLLMLPGAMVLTKTANDRAKDKSDVKEVSRLRKWGRSTMRHRLARPWPLIAAFVLIAAIFGGGLMRLTTSVNVPRMFQANSDIRVQYRWFEKHIGPTVTGDLLLEFPPLGDDDDPLKRLEIVKRAHLAAHRLENVNGVLSAMTFVPTIPRRRSISATATRGVVRKLIRDPESSLGRLDFIDRDSQSELWRLSLRIPQGLDTDLGKEIKIIRDAISSELSATEVPVKVSLTGHVAIVQTAQQVLLRDLFRSFLSAFGIVAIVMMILLRSFVGGLLAMMPNLFPTVALFGFMGLAGVPLDIGSVMTASVALGIAVDGTVHLLSRYGSRRAQGFGQIRATFGALGQCGWAMFQTTLVCGLALMCYWFSNFVPTSRFALLMFGLLTAALFGDVLLLPALMSSFLGKWLSRTVGVDPGAELSADRPAKQPAPDTRRLPTRWSQWGRNRARAPKSKGTTHGSEPAGDSSQTVERS